MYSRQKVKEIKVEGPPATHYPMTTKRREIVERALAQLRKSRAAIDPSVLKKIRRIVAGSPELIKKLGLTEELIHKEELVKQEALKQAPVKVADADMPLSDKGATKAPPKKQVKAAEVRKAEPKPKARNFKPNKQQEPIGKESYEKVDHAKTMEMMAKFIALKPDAKDGLKSVLKKNQK